MQKTLFFTGADQSTLKSLNTVALNLYLRQSQQNEPLQPVPFAR